MSLFLCSSVVPHHLPEWLREASMWTGFGHSPMGECSSIMIYTLKETFVFSKSTQSSIKTKITIHTKGDIQIMEQIIYICV